MEIKVEKAAATFPATCATWDSCDHRQAGPGRSYSPIRRVAYNVESARVEQRTDLDKLIVDIETNGVVEPEEAIRYAARVLMEQLSVFADLEGTAPTIEASKPPRWTWSCPSGGRSRTDGAFGQLPPRPRISTTSAT